MYTNRIPINWKQKNWFVFIQLYWPILKSKIIFESNWKKNIYEKIVDTLFIH